MRSSIVGFALLSACASTNVYGTGGTGGTRGSAGATTGTQVLATAVGATSTGGSTSGAGTSGASSSGGSTGTTGASCDDAWVTAWENGGYLPVAGDCPTGQLELKGRLVNVCGYNGISTPPITVSFTATDAFNPRIAAVTEPCGVYRFCVDAGQLLTPNFQVDGFFSQELATLDISSPPTHLDNEGANGLNLLCNQLLNGLTAVTPALDPSLALVIVSINVEAETAPCIDRTEWSFSLFGPDGGLVDAPYFFINSILPSQDDGGTGASGAQIFYNLDPNLGEVTVSGTRPNNTNPDGGVSCPELSTTDAQFTGSVPLKAATLTQFLYVVP